MLSEDNLAKNFLSSSFRPKSLRSFSHRNLLNVPITIGHLYEFSSADYHRTSLRVLQGQLPLDISACSPVLNTIGHVYFFSSADYHQTSLRVLQCRLPSDISTCSPGAITIRHLCLFSSADYHRTCVHLLQCRLPSDISMCSPVPVTIGHLYVFSSGNYHRISLLVLQCRIPSDMCTSSPVLITIGHLQVFSTYSLQCVQYIYPNTGPYNENHPSTVVNCSSDQDVCMRIHYLLEKRSYTEKSKVQSQRKCAKSSQCNMRESLTTAVYNIAYSTTCCNTSYCVPTAPVLQTRKLPNNGITCPACHAEKSGSCLPERAMSCTGDETHCISLKEVAFNGYSAYSRGCGTKNVFKDNGELISSLSFFSKVTITEESRTHSLGLGNFLWCYACHDEHTTTCTKHPILCPVDSDVCLSEIRRTIDEKSRRLTTQTLRRCAKSNECKFEGTATSAERTLSIKSSCCDTDMCNSPEPIWPLKRKKNNGKSCPACSPLNVSHCWQSDVIQCTDDETYCILYIMTINKVEYSEFGVLYGCSSAGICENPTFKKYETESDNLVMTNDIICSRGIRIINHLFSLVAVLSLLNHHHIM
ncbi:uncharacterized protein LOC134965208 [Pseudophryne corroboree]|uniref:uncharacterized protein LOC134965208 n=1 Tax=Pseudophryne corroboree TaxID=495146 RepID=UPI00308143D2